MPSPSTLAIVACLAYGSAVMSHPMENIYNTIAERDYAIADLAERVYADIDMDLAARMYNGGWEGFEARDELAARNFLTNFFNKILHPKKHDEKESKNPSLGPPATTDDTTVAQRSAWEDTEITLSRRGHQNHTLKKQRKEQRRKNKTAKKLLKAQSDASVDPAVTPADDAPAAAPEESKLSRRGHKSHAEKKQRKEQHRQRKAAKKLRKGQTDASVANPSADSTAPLTDDSAASDSGTLSRRGHHSSTSKQQRKEKHRQKKAAKKLAKGQSGADVADPAVADDASAAPEVAARNFFTNIFNKIFHPKKHDDKKQPEVKNTADAAATTEDAVAARRYRYRREVEW